MSDLAGAAAAMGVPEALVKRSAEARAKATGVSVDEILAAWAGGTTAPVGAASTVPAAGASASSGASAASAAPSDAAADSQEETETEEQTSDHGTVAPTPQPIPSSAARAAAAVSSPPVLVGGREGLGVVFAGSVGLLVMSLLLAVFLPSLKQPGNGIRSSNHAFSSQALDGREIYQSQGCATCHTQLVRNVVTDVGLGPVTLDDTNQVIGSHRIGPDLSAIGGRIEDTAALTALLAGASNHPAATGLSEADIASLIAYMRESR